MKNKILIAAFAAAACVSVGSSEGLLLGIEGDYSFKSSITSKWTDEDYSDTDKDSKGQAAIGFKGGYDASDRAWNLRQHGREQRSRHARVFAFRHRVFCKHRRFGHTRGLAAKFNRSSSLALQLRRLDEGGFAANVRDAANNACGALYNFQAEFKP